MKIILRSILFFLATGVIFWFPETVIAKTSLNARLTSYLAKYELPALAAVVVKNGEFLATGAVGSRRAGTKIGITLKDRFHIGSDTKAMTALLAAMMVEEGKLRWTSTVADVFPELAEKMEPRLRTVTLDQLLSHTSGFPSDNKEIVEYFMKAMTQEGNLDEMRYWLVQEWSKRPLESDPGTKFAYSNMGYTMAGSMIERIARKTWEELITERIFKPLKLKTAGLGSQSSLGKIDAPLGHSLTEGKVKAFLAGPNGDVPPILGPAGIAHMSILDFALWAGWNVGEGKRGPALVNPETLRKLHTPVISLPLQKDAAPGTPPGGKYGLGWGELPVDWAPYPIIYHGGSNTMNLALIWLDTKLDFAMVMATNIGGPKAKEALMALSKELYGQFSKK